MCLIARRRSIVSCGHALSMGVLALLTIRFCLIVRESAETVHEEIEET